jgi:hypothetical protein
MRLEIETGDGQLWVVCGPSLAASERRFQSSADIRRHTSDRSLPARRSMAVDGEQ